jgi:hypothetical protein
VQGSPFVEISRPRAASAIGQRAGDPNRLMYVDQFVLEARVPTPARRRVCSRKGRMLLL